MAPDPRAPAPRSCRPTPDAGDDPRGEALGGILARLGLGAGLAIALSTVGLVIAAYDPLPFWDQWDNLVSGSDVTWSWLVSQHNEHRIAVGRLLFLADHLCCGETYRLAFAANILLPLATAGLLIRLVRDANPLLPPFWIVGLALGTLFTALQSENFILAFQAQFFVLPLLVLGALMLLVLGPPTLLSLCGVVVLEAAALLTLSSGAVLLPLTTLIAALTRRPWWQAGILAIVGVVLLYAYLRGYGTPEGDADPLESLSHLGQVALFGLVALGHPLGVLVPVVTGPLALGMGIVGLAWFSIRGWRSVTRPRDRTPEELVLVGLAAFVIGMVVLMGLGRWRLGIGQALVPRYATPTLMFWLSMLMVEAVRATGRRRNLVLGLGVAVLGVLLVEQPRFILPAQQGGPVRQAAALGILAGVEDDDLLRRTYPVPGDLMADREAMKAGHTSVFRADWADWLDQTFAIPAGWPVRPCPGDVEQVVRVGGPDHPGWRLNGHLDASKLPKLSGRLVVADADGIVRGYGFSRLPDRAAFTAADPARRPAWLAEVEDLDPSTLRAYPLRGDGLPACRLDPIRPGR